MNKITIDVIGIRCNSCEMLIKDSLEETDGVSFAEAKADPGKVEIDFDEHVISMDNLKSIIRDNGFEVD